MKCPQCQAEIAEGKNFCSDCGALLTPQLIPAIRTQVEGYIRERFRDQELVDVRTTEAIAERFVRWGKWFLIPATILLTMLGVILALLGLRDYREFHNTVHQATVELKPKLEQAVAEADTATKKAQAAETKSDEAIKAIDAATLKMNTQLHAASALSTTVSGLETKTASQIADANKHVEGRVSELDKMVEAANKAITEQQSKLVSTNELVSAMFSKGQVEMFETDKGNTPTCAVIPLTLPPVTAALKAPPQAVVYMVLKYPAINQTVQINYRIYVQPKSSYFVNGNVLTFFWGDNIPSLKQWPIEVSYVPDPTYKGPVYKTLSVKDGGIVFDQPPNQPK